MKARLILVSKEYDEDTPLPEEMPDPTHWKWYVVWSYPEQSIDEKWAQYDMAQLSLAEIIRRGEEGE